MEVVFNDYSLDSQFSSIEDFLDSLIDNTFVILKYLSEQDNLLLKSYETYSRPVTSMESIYDILVSQKYRGFPEIRKLKSLLVQLSSEPFWQSNVRTDETATYHCSFLGDFFGTSPNCFSEAVERDKFLLSIKHDNFEIDLIDVKKNGKTQTIYNLFDKKNAAKKLFSNGNMTFVNLLSCIIEDEEIVFCSNGSHYYADELWNNGDLSKEDVLKIANDFEILIEGKKTGKILARLTDSITYGKDTYMEFRTTLKDGREFRMFYYVDGCKWVFLDTLIKKTEATPLSVKKRTCKLLGDYKR